ncbi:MAG: hypothetical protein ACOYXO_06435 [Chloroflexota bacterium]
MNETTITQSQTLAGFQVDFVECLINEAFSIGLKNIEAPYKDLIENAYFLLDLLLCQAQGNPINEVTLKEVPDCLAELTCQIWELGGSFSNSSLEYQKKTE